ncbi:MAG: TonB family protein [bacterium]
MTTRRPGEMSLAFVLAVGLHVAGVMLLVAAIRYWPVAARALRPAPLELDMAAAPTPSPAVAVPPVMDQVMAAIPSERRALAMSAVPIPEARPAEVPEPAFPVSSFRENPQSETFQIPRETVGVPAVSPPAIQSAVPQGRDGAGRPMALSEIKPYYPYAARTRGEDGWVTIHLRVSARGEADSVEVKSSSGHPSLDDSALSAARKARFKPAERDGKPVPAEMDLQFEFRLQE